MSSVSVEEKISKLPIWKSAPTIEPLGGGMTNENFLVTENGRRFVVRLGGDIPFHHVIRFNELAASRAAYAAGVSPAIIYNEPGVLVLDFIEGRTLTPEDLRGSQIRQKAISLIRRSHLEIPAHLQGPAPIFRVFHILRDYARFMREEDSPYKDRLADYLRIIAETEARSGPYDIVFGHNDLLAANFLDDGERLWLIDWEYAGFNSPLFDLAGMASNSRLTEGQQKAVLENYFEAPLNDDLWGRYQAMKVVSLLREVMWSMVSELYSTLDFDYSSYTRNGLTAFDAAYETFRKDYL
ncbi:MAG: phosphotransferase family protein [Sneathiella sp.]|nr:phosphotransferase family protein [Sneathiella sp.]